MSGYPFWHQRMANNPHVELSPTLTRIKMIFGEGESISCRIVDGLDMRHGLNAEIFASPLAVSQTAFFGEAAFDLHYILRRLLAAIDSRRHRAQRVWLLEPQRRLQPTVCGPLIFRLQKSGLPALEQALTAREMRLGRWEKTGWNPRSTRQRHIICRPS